MQWVRLSRLRLLLLLWRQRSACGRGQSRRVMRGQRGSQGLAARGYPLTWPGMQLLAHRPQCTKAHQARTQQTGCAQTKEKSFL